MAVTVILSRHGDSGSPSTLDVYDTATAFTVTDDGHLMIRKDDGAIGAYPPGRWVTVSIDESQTWTKVGG
jgi:hypothetical protein